MAQMWPAMLRCACVKTDHDRRTHQPITGLGSPTQPSGHLPLAHDSPTDSPALHFAPRHPSSVSLRRRMFQHFVHSTLVFTGARLHAQLQQWGITVRELRCPRDNARRSRTGCLLLPLFNSVAVVALLCFSSKLLCRCRAPRPLCAWLHGT